MYDQVGGGFHRYSTDARLAGAALREDALRQRPARPRLPRRLQASPATPFYRRIAERDARLRPARDDATPAGGFYSTQDADSEGDEGKFFVWTPARAARACSATTPSSSARYFGVTDGGNFEGTQHPQRAASTPERFAEPHGLDADAASTACSPAPSATLYAAREQRVHPGRDDKVLTAWNGLMLRAFAEAALRLRRRRATATPPCATPTSCSTRAAARRPAAAHAGRTASRKLQRLPRGLRLPHRRPARALRRRPSSRATCAAAIELADEMIDLFWDDDVAGLLRHRPRPRDADHPPARPLRQRHAVRHLRRRRRAAAPRRCSPTTPTTSAAPSTCLRAVAPYRRRAPPRPSAALLCALDFHLSTPQELAHRLAGRRRRRRRAAARRRSRLPTCRNLLLVGAPEGAGRRPHAPARRPPAAGRRRHRLPLRALRLPGPNHRPGGAEAAVGIVSI